MRKSVLIVLFFLAIVGGAQTLAIRAQGEHEGDKQDEKEPKRIDPLHGQHHDLVNDHEPKGKGHEVLGPSMFASTSVGVIFFVAGMVGWVALGIATWILLQMRPPPTHS